MIIDDQEVVVVGRFGRFFGIWGWIRVVLSASLTIEYFMKLSKIFIRRRKSELWQKLAIDGLKLFNDTILLKIKGYNSKEEVSKLTNADLGILRKDLPKLGDDEYYWSELIGLTIINNSGQNIGIVKSIITTGSNDVLVVEGDCRRLIPYISEVIMKIDLENRSILVDWGFDYL